MRLGRPGPPKTRPLSIGDQVGAGGEAIERILRLVDAAAGEDGVAGPRPARSARTVATASARATAPRRMMPARTCATLDDHAAERPRACAGVSAVRVIDVGGHDEQHRPRCRAMEPAVGDDGGPVGIDHRAGGIATVNPATCGASAAIRFCARLGGRAAGSEVAQLDARQHGHAADAEPGRERTAVALAGALERRAQDRVSMARSRPSGPDATASATNGPTSTKPRPKRASAAVASRSGSRPQPMPMRDGKLEAEHRRPQRRRAARMCPRTSIRARPAPGAAERAHDAAGDRSRAARGGSANSSGPQHGPIGPVRHRP